MSDDNSLSRRDLLAAAAAGGLAASTSGDETTKSKPEDLYQPESYWANRMQAPDDGKKYGWLIDTRRCFGCHACEVSCKAENDVPLGHYIRQTMTKDVGEYPQVARMFLPMACQHCEDAPCIKACPCGALGKETGGTVAIDYNVCCGHGTCVDVCPYGALYMDPVAHQAVKCHNCYHRLEQDMEPACVPTCPSEALYFGDLNDEKSPIRMAMDNMEKQGVDTQQLRPEKQTSPRMWFAGEGVTAVEDRVPTEGQSYSPAGYNIYGWKENPTAGGTPNNPATDPQQEAGQ
ncbi:MAG: 4Fe-4S dicluster domain-containing protein [Planctomycetaceae bacterium]|nr:4Fe-4S dicluster domain-containing protein [Planctomycetaceae bacterium]